MLGVLWLGARQVGLGELEGVALGALALLAFSCFEAFAALPLPPQQLSGSLAAAGRLFEMADSPAEVSEPPEPLPVPERFSLQIKRLSFRYPGEEQAVLENLSLAIQPGQKIALLGESGSGKSTLLHLLLRFWNSPSGAILLDGQELGKYAGDALRKKISVLPQNPYLFSGTLRDNLRLAHPGASQEQIESAARRACLHEWVETLPAGYQTWTGEGGVKLSGGQRQRLALARALLRPAPLYLLDEPTAHLDPETARRVMRNILELEAAVLLVTHRMGELERFDRVYVLEAGNIKR